jgi:hypothetical protein
MTSQEAHKAYLEAPKEVACNMDDFHDLLVGRIVDQYDRYPVYREICRSHHTERADIERVVRDRELHRIPAVPATLFKRSKGMYRDLVDLDKKGQWLVSGTTSGDPSYTWRTDNDIECIERAYREAYSHTPKCHMLTFGPSTESLRRIGARFAIDDRPIAFYGSIPSGTADEVFPSMDHLVELDLARTILSMAVRLGKGKPVFRIDRKLVLREIARSVKEGTEISFASAILLLHQTLKSLQGSFPLGNRAYFVVGGGGWDGKKGSTRGEPIDKDRFIREMCRKFDMPGSCISTNFVDIYGTAENAKAHHGFYSVEHKDFVFRVGADARLVVIDPKTLKPVGAGKRGNPIFISPFGAEGCAGACIEQNDIMEPVSFCDDGSVREYTHVFRMTQEGCAYEYSRGVQFS